MHGDVILTVSMGYNQVMICTRDLFTARALDHGVFGLRLLLETSWV